MKYALIRMILITSTFLFFGINCQQKTDVSDQVYVKEIANKILEARSTNTHIQPISKTNANVSLDKAYEIQIKLSEELSKTYGPIVGYKLGYSDSISLERNNISIPVYGPIFKDQIKKSGEIVQASDFHNFSIENEIVFTIAKTIEHKINSIEELVPFVKSVHIGFDMSEGIFDGPTTIVDCVANGADSKYFVLSKGLDPVKTNISDLKLSVIFDGRTVYKGSSNKVLGNPWFALKEVANDLIRRGYPLKAGNVIFSGKVAPAYKIRSDNAVGMYKGVGNTFNDIYVIVK